MRRGNIVAAIGRGDFSTKPRPSVVVQADLFLAEHPAIVVCPITSQTTGDNLYRIVVPADADTGLLHESEVEIDRLQAVRRERLGRTIGAVSDEVMALVDDAVRRWLAL